MVLTLFKNCCKIDTFFLINIIYRLTRAHDMCYVSLFLLLEDMADEGRKICRMWI